MNKNSVSNITKAALFLAIGQVLPFITGQIPQIGVMLSPMHFPVLLCGFFCGWKYGMIVGLICPLLRSVLFGFPVMFPMAIGMAFELMTYGFVSGLLAELIGTDKLAKIYVTLIIAMISGRIVWGLAQMVLLGITGGQFTFAAFLGGALLNAIPGIILQLILIPLIVNAFSKLKSA